jgi:hypothetical protein
MPRPRKAALKKRSSKKNVSNRNYVIVTNKSYGNKLKGIKIYFEGKKPTTLKADGSISFGKNILELLKKNFQKFQWILTDDTNEIKHLYGITRIRTSVKAIQKMYSLSYDRTRDVKEDIIKKTFSVLYPKSFSFEHAEKYKPGNIASILRENIFNDLSADDKEALNKFLPDYIAKESVSTVNVLKATTQIKTLKEIADEMKTEINSTRSESWWQSYIHKNILIIQQGYIQAIEKMNITVGGTKFPDFSLITHDNFLDILEIKKPSTVLIKEDTSRGNFYWDTEIVKAIIQVENYIENVSKQSDAVRSYIKDNHGIDLKVVRPRGIILAGESGNFASQKQKDDFRLLTLAAKNINFVTYDELVTRLENYIEVLEKFSKK